MLIPNFFDDDNDGCNDNYDNDGKFDDNDDRMTINQL